MTTIKSSYPRYEMIYRQRLKDDWKTIELSIEKAAQLLDTRSTEDLITDEEGDKIVDKYFPHCLEVDFGKKVIFKNKKNRDMTNDDRYEIYEMAMEKKYEDA